ncbi:hypothetical protein A6V39_03910 [Candidatus Mycoplasma haematobovis]|uniref:Uncharacterized protein n=1 Tax=Candidatus Mycoplasma haematobovis TaxID=432608 RepID=A0A1A9QC49_9MOLU|nr:hypothetical protein [Candidatus Mycoplasma haematobovis]OAL10033.1 hypothetical protein A6V39_03910 [Candidatus Mycoplasma haematobovis]
MAGITVKIVAGTLTAGAIGGAGYGVHALTDTTDTVKNYLEKSKFILTKENETDLWTKAFGTYGLEKAGFKIPKTISNGNDIRDWCKETLNKKIKSEEEANYKIASKWCVHYTTISDKLKGKNLVDDASKLNDKISSFSKDIQTEINNTQVDASTNQNGEKVKKWCQENVKRTFTKESENYFSNINSHCLAGPA